MVSTAGESSNGESNTNVDEVLTKEDDIDNQNLLTKFWNLASLNEEVRISSSIGIIKELKSSQKKVWPCIGRSMVFLFVCNSINYLPIFSFVLLFAVIYINALYIYIYIYIYMHLLYINTFYQNICLQIINFEEKTQKDRQH